MLSLPETGDVLGSKYRVVSRIGEGGMGTVFRAQNTLTGKHVALKWLHSTLAASTDGSARLLREARAASTLSHPHVVDVYDVVEDGATLFLVMELLEGETLRAYLRRNPLPRIAEFIALLRPAMQGVAAAHERGVVHRDLKPDNIFLARSPGSTRPHVKVLDFGVAKMVANQSVTLTETGAVLGTPLFMSLEQLRGDRDVDARTDIYAFGVMLYEAITGRLPFSATSLSELAIKVATSHPPPIDSLRNDVPRALVEIVERAMAKDREQRTPGVAILIEQLDAFASAYGGREDGELISSLPAASESSESGVIERRTTAEYSPKPADAGARVPAAASQAQPLRADSLTGRELASSPRGRRRLAQLWLAFAALALFSGVAAFRWLRRDTAPPVSSPVVSVSADRSQAASASAPAGPAAVIEPDPDLAAREAPSLPQLPTPESDTQAIPVLAVDTGAESRPSIARKRASGTRSKVRPNPVAENPPPSQRPDPIDPTPHRNAAEVLGF